jgi:hypothetical protein
MLVSGLSTRRSEFDSRSVYVRFVENLTLEQVFLLVFQFSVVSIIAPVLHAVFNNIFLLSEGQTSEAWEPSKKQWTFGNGGC